jgi:hypothetical protein
VPFDPPNVAGWRQNDYWISASSFYGRAESARNCRWRASSAGVLAETPKMAPARAVDRAFATFGIDQPSAATRAALVRYVDEVRSAGSWETQSGLLQLLVMTPDFNLY